MINPNAHPALLRFTDDALGGEDSSSDAVPPKPINPPCATRREPDPAASLIPP